MSSGNTPSGGKRAMVNIPKAQDFMANPYPELVGTEKQVKWAEQIREEAGQNMAEYVLGYKSDGSRMGGAQMLEVAQKGANAIYKDVSDNPLVNSIRSPKLRAEKIEKGLAAYSDLANRMGRWNKLFSNTSAKFWIDNRPNQPNNYLYEGFKKQIDGK